MKNSGYKMKAEIEFLKYGTVSAKDKSGAYLFMPDGPAKVSNEFRNVLICY